MLLAGHSAHSISPHDGTDSRHVDFGSKGHKMVFYLCNPCNAKPVFLIRSRSTGLDVFLQTLRHQTDQLSFARFTPSRSAACPATKPSCNPTASIGQQIHLHITMLEIHLPSFFIVGFHNQEMKSFPQDPIETDCLLHLEEEPQMAQVAQAYGS